MNIPVNNFWHVSHESTISQIVAIWLTVVGSFALLMLPLLVGSMGDSLGISPKEMGFLASADLVGMGLSSGLAVFWVRKVPWRISAIAALATFVAANLLTTQVTSYSALIVIRFIAGLGGGSAMAIGLACQSDSKHASRLFGYFITSQMFCIFLGFMVLGKIRLTYGLDGVLMGIVVLTLPTMLLVMFLPKKGIDRAAAIAKGNISWDKPIICLFFAFCFFTSVGGIWAFSEGIGVAGGLAKGEISQTLGFAAFAAMAGSLLAAKFTEKLGLKRILIVTAVIAASALYLFNAFNGSTEFLITVCVFQLGAAMGVPLMLALINTFDSTGKLVVLMLGVIKLGYAAGPALMGQVIQNNNYSMVFFYCAILSLTGLLGNSLLVHFSQQKSGLTKSLA